MRLVRYLMSVFVIACFAAGPVLAEGKSLILVADKRLDASGLLKYILPRFGLKKGIRVHVKTAGSGELVETAPGSDALLGPVGAAESLQQSGRGKGLRAAFYVDGAAEDETYAALLLEGGENPEHAAVFVDWLTSEIGQRTVAAYAPADHPGYVPGAIEVESAAAPLPEGDVDEGEKLAYLHCGRCHVISDKNRFGGIGSTPSFPALRAIPDWQQKFTSFWVENPHLSFTRIIDISPPFDPDRPPHIVPVVLTQEEMEAIIAFAAKIEPKDLGAAINAR